MIHSRDGGINFNFKFISFLAIERFKNGRFKNKKLNTLQGTESAKVAADELHCSDTDE